MFLFSFEEEERVGLGRYRFREVVQFVSVVAIVQVV